MLEFSSDYQAIKGGKIFINIEFEEAELTAKEAMEEFMDDCELGLSGEFFPVKRGEGTALAAYYTGEGNISHFYEERYDFPLNSFRQNQVTVSIQVTSFQVKKLGKTIHDVLKLPNVKAFLDSIEYY